MCKINGIDGIKLFKSKSSCNKFAVDWIRSSENVSKFRTYPVIIADTLMSRGTHLPIHDNGHTNTVSSLNFGSGISSDLDL